MCAERSIECHGSVAVIVRHVISLYFICSFILSLLSVELNCLSLSLPFSVSVPVQNMAADILEIVELRHAIWGRREDPTPRASERGERLYKFFSDHFDRRTCTFNYRLSGIPRCETLMLHCLGVHLYTQTRRVKKCVIKGMMIFYA